MLLERGTPRNETEEFLVRASRNLFETHSTATLAESYQSLPNPGANGQTREILAGNTLGGSSSINGQQFTIPVGRTVEKWRIKGLSTQVAKKYYRRAFRTLGVAQPPQSLRLVYGRDYINAAKERGFRESFDPFDTSNNFRIWYSRLVADKSGRRVDSYTAYVEPVINRKCKGRLRLMQGITVTRIVLGKGRRKRAIGVEFIRSGVGQQMKQFVKARKEVIVSAGPFESPKLLQLSGIGPRQILRMANIKIQVALPVGKRTQSRSGVFFVSRYRAVPLEPANNGTLLDSNASVEMFKKGEGGVYAKTVTSTNSVLRGLGYSSSAWAFGRRTPFINLPLLLSVCVGNSKSFGFVRVKDNNPFSSPLVHTNILGTQSDMAKLLACLKKTEGIHSTLSQKFDFVQVAPNGKIDEAFIRKSALYTHHFVGGCAVGRVVGDDLKVLRVKNLRIIDASVLRVLPASSGPMASVYMLAEYASEMMSKIYSELTSNFDSQFPGNDRKNSRASGALPCVPEDHSVPQKILHKIGSFQRLVNFQKIKRRPCGH